MVSTYTAETRFEPIRLSPKVVDLLKKIRLGRLNWKKRYKLLPKNYWRLCSSIFKMHYWTFLEKKLQGHSIFFPAIKLFHSKMHSEFQIIDPFRKFWTIGTRMKDRSCFIVLFSWMKEKTIVGSIRLVWPNAETVPRLIILCNDRVGNKKDQIWKCSIEIYLKLHLVD